MRGRATELPLCPVWSRRECSNPQARRRELARTWSGWHPDLRIPPSRTVRNMLPFLKAPHLWYFVRVALRGFPGGSDGKASACNARDLGSIPGSVISPGEGNGDPLQDSCLENPMDRGAWWATVRGVAQSQT